MKRLIRLGVLIVIAACGKQGAGIPPVTFLSPPDSGARAPTYSPDGRRLAYVRFGGNVIDLVVARPDLGGARVITSGLFLSGGDSPGPVWSPDGLRIAYPVADAHGFSIWVASLDSLGSAPRKLTTGPGNAFPLQWHPDGERLAYGTLSAGGAAETRVFSFATETSAPMVAGTGPSLAVWSPDGSRVAMERWDGARTTIWLADSAGRDPRQLTTEGFETLPLQSQPWSPDGTAILFVSRRTGMGDVWIWSLEGDSARQLTRDVLEDDAPAWSPDGRWVAFRSHRGRQTDLWMIPAAGGTARRVTDDPAEETPPQWMPGSQRITYSTGSFETGLWVRSTVDGTERRLTPDSIRVTDEPTGPEWDLSPDGSRLVYQVMRGGGVSDVQVVPVEGGAARTLVADGHSNTAPQWSPDGSRILYLSDRRGVTDAWVVDSAGHTPRRITEWPAPVFEARWSRDGSAIYVLTAYQSTIGDLWLVPVAGGAARRITHAGSVVDVAPSPYSDDVFVLAIGDSTGFIAARVKEDGGLQTLWNRTSVAYLPPHGFIPSGDSLTLQVVRPGGAMGMILLPTAGGAERSLADEEKDHGAMDWTPDGTRLLYWIGYPYPDLAVYDRATGTTRRLTTTPEMEFPARWLPDGEHVVFLRGASLQRIATVDVLALMTNGNLR